MASRIINIILIIACVMAIIALNHAPPPQVSSPSTKILLKFPKLDEQILDRPVADMDFTKIALDVVTQKVGASAGVPIHVDWAAIGSPGLLTIDTFTFHVKNATLADALWAIVGGLVATGHNDVDFDVIDGSVTITTTAAVNRRRDVECFSVRSLSAEMARNAPWLVNGEPQVGRYHGESADDQIMQLLATNVEPSSWKDTGGTVGSLFNLSGVLALAHTPKSIGAAREQLTALEMATRTPGVTIRSHPGPT